MFTTKRADGTYLKDIHHFNKLLPYVMPTRTESTIYFEQEFDVTATMDYLKAVNEGASRRLTLFQVFLTAAVRTLALRPRLNRFVAGYRYYQRNRIVCNFVAKKELSDHGEEINITMAFSPEETLATLPAKVNARVNRVRTGGGSGTDDLNKTLAKLPRWLLRIVFRVLKWLDYHNALPLGFTGDMPFFSTIFFTNVGSVGVDAPFHHNFEFGTCGLFAAIGLVRRVHVPQSDGSLEERRKVKVTFTYDDRIADGIYCGKAIDLLRRMVENPAELQDALNLDQPQKEALMLRPQEYRLHQEEDYHG